MGPETPWMNMSGMLEACPITPKSNRCFDLLSRPTVVLLWNSSCPQRKFLTLHVKDYLSYPGVFPCSTMLAWPHPSLHFLLLQIAVFVIPQIFVFNLPLPFHHPFSFCLLSGPQLFVYTLNIDLALCSDICIHLIIACGFGCDHLVISMWFIALLWILVGEDNYVLSIWHVLSISIRSSSHLILKRNLLNRAYLHFSI